MSTAYASLAIETLDHVATVTLTGPGKGNPLGPDFWREMPGAFAQLDADANVRAIVLRGSGAHFSYGMDLIAMGGMLAPALAEESLARPRTDLLDTVMQMQSAVTAVEVCRKPVIAAVAGWCIGGGLDLAAACDVRVCSADAKFSVREVKLAMVADMGSLQRLPLIVGQGVARELAFTGDDVDAPRALRIGLVNDVFGTHDALFQGALAMATRIAQNPPLAVQGTKRVMNHSVGRPVADGLRAVAVWNAAFVASHDLREAITAFMEKRPPMFRGE